MLTWPVTRHIIGYKREESDNLLKFLYDHIAFGADFQARVKWAEKSVVVWDVGLPQCLVLDILTTVESRDWPLGYFRLGHWPAPASCSDHTPSGGTI